MPVPPGYLNSDGHLRGCQEYCVDETGVCHGCQTFVGKVPVTKTFCGSGFNPDHYTQFGITYGEYHNCPQGDHEPHVVSYYETVRYGSLEKFCMGRNSKTITSYTPGSAEYPAILQTEEFSCRY